MNTKMTYRGMESSPTIEEYVNTKIGKLERFLHKERSPIKLEVILEAQHVHTQHAVELRLHAADYHVRAQVEGKDLYALIDEAFDVLLKEINKKKGKRLDERKEPDPYREPE
jgi:ribosomal subunit interface protein